MRSRIIEAYQAATTQVITSNSTAATLTNIESAAYFKASGAVITVEDANIRIGLGGRIPAATTGHKIDVGDVVNLQGWDELKYFQHMRAGTTNAKLQVTYLFPEGYHVRG